MTFCDKLSGVITFIFTYTNRPDWGGSWKVKGKKSRAEKILF